LTFKQIKIYVLVGLLALAGQASSAVSDDRNPADLAQKATQAIQAGNKNLAIYYYTQALLRDPSQNRWREWVAQAHRERGDKGDALRHARLLLKADPANSRAAAIVAELSVPVTSASLAQEEAAAAEKAASLVPFPDKTRMVLPKGVAAWVVGNPVEQVQTINQYNASAPKSQQIRYLFIECGEVGINNGKLSLQFDPEPALQLVEVLIGDVWVMPLISGNSRGAGKVAMAEWQRMGKLIGEKVEAERRLAGVYFEIAPLKAELNPLFAMVKQATHNPVAAGGFQWEALSFKYTDFMVLKAFGYSSDLRLQAGQLRSDTTAFLKDARVMEGKAFIGLPGVAATQEYEEKRQSPDEKGLRTGKSMNAFFSNGLGWTRRALVESDPAFMGIALWALYSGDGVHGVHDTAWYYPSKLDPDILEKLKLPVERECGRH
jgi:hypothetical protein